MEFGVYCLRAGRAKKPISKGGRETWADEPFQKDNRVEYKAY